MTPLFTEQIMDTLSMIRHKRTDAITSMEEPIICFTLEQMNSVLKLIDDLDKAKKTLMHDLATVNIQLGSKK